MDSPPRLITRYLNSNFWSPSQWCGTTTHCKIRAEGAAGSPATTGVPVPLRTRMSDPNLNHDATGCFLERPSSGSLAPPPSDYQPNESRFCLVLVHSLQSALFCGVRQLELLARVCCCEEGLCCCTRTSRSSLSSPCLFALLDLWPRRPVRSFLLVRLFYWLSLSFPPSPTHRAHQLLLLPPPPRLSLTQLAPLWYGDNLISSRSVL